MIKRRKEKNMSSAKDSVLTRLSENKDKFTSGQTLANELSVTRCAIWKAVCGLRKDGYVIESVSNKGYKLHESDILSEAEIKSHLKTSIPPKIIVFDSIDSTNSKAKEYAANGHKETTLIIANSQTNGKGRMGRTFYSPKDTGLYMSLLYTTSQPLENAVSVTTAASVAVALAIEEMTGSPAHIKWVNDVYMDGKKVCGILTEAMLGLDGDGENVIIVGIGINITTKTFPEELADKAASTGTLSGSRCLLAAKIIDRLIYFIENPSEKTHMGEYRKRSLINEKKVRLICAGNEFFGTAMGISDDGGLIFLPDGEENCKVIRSGEVSVRLND